MYTGVVIFGAFFSRPLPVALPDPAPIPVLPAFSGPPTEDFHSPRRSYYMSSYYLLLILVECGVRPKVRRFQVWC